MTESKSEKKNKIVFLVNSINYLLDWVIIVFEDEGYRLIVSNRGAISTDRYYETLKGAKIAFIRQYRFAAFSNPDIPEWSPPYRPDDDWLEQKTVYR
jgi:hypothetical protein